MRVRAHELQIPEVHVTVIAADEPVYADLVTDEIGDGRGDRRSTEVARRILDRIVGYQISPLLWKKVGSRLSAGRVQSVALRLIVERERAIKAFIPVEYWQIAAECYGMATRPAMITTMKDPIIALPRPPPSVPSGAGAEKKKCQLSPGIPRFKSWARMLTKG